MTSIRLKKMTTATEITTFWQKKREYEDRDIFPFITETGQERAEIITWFKSKEYYDIIMKLHNDSSNKGSGLQFGFFYNELNHYLGLTMYKIYQNEDGKCFILDFCIAPAYRNKQLGKQVVNYLEAYLREHEGAKYFALNVSNEDNQRFWERQGYQLVQSDNDDELVLVKK